MRSVTSGSLQSTASEKQWAGSDRRIPLGPMGPFFRHTSGFQLSPGGKINRLDIGQAA